MPSRPLSGVTNAATTSVSLTELKPTSNTYLKCCSVSV